VANDVQSLGQVGAIHWRVGLLGKLEQIGYQIAKGQPLIPKCLA
jgi:hypothetical protein